MGVGQKGKVASYLKRGEKRRFPVWTVLRKEASLAR